ncbi:hypothetical protein [Longitalea arenae]|uniref:hypothetical protein n=1 Tax=Longitalea arenae TaxID=2812558 RepID=UPI001967C5D9|nr:hypothetical protein [Longitalea arenae]
MRMPSTAAVTSSAPGSGKLIPLTTADCKKQLKKYLRKKKKPAPAKERVKAKLPDGLYFGKENMPKGHVMEFMPFKIWLKKKDKRVQEKKKKLRGARKKEAARLYKLEYPFGEPRASKPAPRHKGIIDTSVLQRFLGTTPRNARKIFNIMKKDMGKKREHLVTVDEYCRHKNIPKEDIIPYL